MTTKFIQPSKFFRKTARHAPSPNTAPRRGGMVTVVLVALDATGSMQGVIDAIKAGILHMVDEFAKHDFPVMIGLVVFRDETFGEAPILYPIGTPAAEVRRILADERATGGGDAPESSLPAIMKALDLPGAPEGAKTVLLHITDDGCHDPEQGYTAKSVRDALASHGVLYFGCTPRIKPYISFANATGGDLLEIGPGISKDAFSGILDQFTQKTITTLRYTAKANDGLDDVVRKTKLRR